MHFVQPSLKSSKIAARSSFFSGLGWNVFFQLNLAGENIKNKFIFFIEEVDEITNKISLEQNQYQNQNLDHEIMERLQILQKISSAMQTKRNDVMQCVDNYLEISNFLLALRSLIGDSQLENLLGQCYELNLDSHFLSSCYTFFQFKGIEMTNLETLVEKYVPERAEIPLEIKSENLDEIQSVLETKSSLLEKIVSLIP